MRKHLASFAMALTLGGLVAMAASWPVLAADPPQNDNLNATIWTQQSAEFKGHALGTFALAKIRLDQALADTSWTAAAEQSGAYQDLPPAVILDADETLLDNSAYQAWMVLNDESFHPKTWDAFVKTETSTAVPGAVDFTKYADGKGVKVFYVSNRDAGQEEATRRNLEKLGFPMGGNVDTVLLKKEREDWGSAKGTRRAVVAKDYRILLMVGDNFGDFVDAYKGTPAERDAIVAQSADHWGKDWLVIANPTYGSFESAPFGHNYRLSGAEKRQMKRETLRAWQP